MSARLDIANLSKTFASRGTADVAAMSGIDLQVEPGQFMALLGPSGCGKTTLLRSIAGIEVPDSGSISINGKTVFDAATGVNLAGGARQLGMVFQSLAIWPHMSVRQNVAFPLEAGQSREGLSQKKKKDRVDNILSMVNLDAMADRPAHVLSGGQKQRLALARAVVAEPGLILLDEPLSSLDANLRHRMRRELRLLQAELGTTFIYVTHDQTEALSMAHRVAVMDNGRILQVGSPAEIYHRPKSQFVAQFLGEGTTIGGPLAERILGEPGTFIARPEALTFSANRQDGHGWLPCEILRTDFLGGHMAVVLRVQGQEISAHANWKPEIVTGGSGFVHFDREKLVRFTE